MLELIFGILMIVLFVRLLILAVKAAWGIAKVIGFLIVLPLALIFIAIRGLVIVAIIGLIIAGIGSLIIS